MNRLEELQSQIEEERVKMDQMLQTMKMTEVLEQSRKLDELIEEYLMISN